MRWRELTLQRLRAPDDPGAGDPPAGDPPAGDPPPDWVSTLDDGGRALVQTKGWKTPGDAILSYAELERKVGANKVVLPGKDASEEDWGKFYDAIGRPESADGYELKMPEGQLGDEAQIAWLREVAHKRGFSKAQTEGLFEDWNAFQAERNKEIGNLTATMLGALKQEWGDEYDAKLEGAGKAMLTIMSAEDAELATHLKLMDGTYLLDHPVLAKAFDKLRELTGEDGGMPRGGRGGGDPMSSPAAAQAEIQRIRSEAAENDKHPLNNTKHPEHQAMNERMNTLYKTAYPEGGEA